jgi:hypothetical protein
MSGEERAQRLSMLKKLEKALFPETSWTGKHFWNPENCPFVVTNWKLSLVTLMNCSFWRLFLTCEHCSVLNNIYESVVAIVAPLGTVLSHYTFSTSLCSILHLQFLVSKQCIENWKGNSNCNWSYWCFLAGKAASVFSLFIFHVQAYTHFYFLFMMVLSLVFVLFNNGVIYTWVTLCIQTTCRIDENIKLSFFLLLCKLLAILLSGIICSLNAVGNMVQPICSAACQLLWNLFFYRFYYEDFQFFGEEGP